MNWALSREIYGNTPWAVDGETFAALTSMLNDLRNGINLQSPTEKKLNSIHLCTPESAVKVLTSTWELNEDAAGNDLIYVINLNGVITKAGGMSSYGMKELSEKLLKFDADSRVIGGIIVTDSGGGSTLGMELMQFTLGTLRKKPIVGYIERTGMACSAAIGILSYTDCIIAEDNTSKVGSFGTMLSMGGYVNKSVNGDNAKQITVYATKSFNKNKAYEEAINNDNYELIISEILDPVNERFLSGVKAQRPNITDDQLDGSVFNAGDVVGSIVDEIADFEAAVNKVIALSTTQKFKLNSNNNNKKNPTAMTAQELKSQHPAAYNDIFGAGLTAGITAEKDRCGAWMAHSSTDLEAVKKGIASGGAISATDRENLLVKANSVKKIKDLTLDSAENLLNPESSEEVVSDADKFYNTLSESLKAK